MLRSTYCLRRVPERALLTCTLAALAGLITGCGTSFRTAVTEPAAVHPPPSTASTQTAAAITVPAPEPEIADGAAITVDQIVRRAAARNPSREVFEATRAAAAAQLQLASAWANPELELSGGRAKARDGSTSESIYGLDLRQRFELPGKRSSRMEAARAGQAVTEREVAIDSLALESSVREACAELVAAEATLTQAQVASEAAEQMLKAVDLRVKAREADSGEAARAKLELIIARSVRDQAEREVIGNRAAVRVWVGGGLPEHFTISDGLPTDLPLVDRSAALATAIERNPRLALMRAQIDVRSAELAREQRVWQPDITVGVFSARESDSENLGLSVGVEIPLWNRNQGGIAVADAERRKALAQMRAEQQIITREVDLAWQRYESRRLALGAMLTEAKAAAQVAINAKLAAFAAGEASLLDVLEARRAALAVDHAVLEARRSAADARLALGRAMGSFTITPTIPAGVQP